MDIIFENGSVFLKLIFFYFIDFWIKKIDDNKWIKFFKSCEGFLKIDLLKVCMYCYYKFIGFR